MSFMVSTLHITSSSVISKLDRDICEKKNA